MDERTRYFRRLKRLRSSARRWSVLGGGLTAATAVLTPYSGIGWADAIWAGTAGASVALAWWRFSDHRELAATPAPPAPDPALAAGKLTAAIERFPAGRTVVNEVRRQKNRYALRGSAITQAWDRLDRASATLTMLAGRLHGPGQAALLEAATAEQWLRDLGQRVAGVERALPITPPDQRDALTESHASLAAQFTEGVDAYERLVAAAASYVAEDGHPMVEGKHPAFASLVDAADRLRGVAEGLSELKRPAAGAGSAGTSM
ncbi:phage shock envelope stress response protein PspM [Actinoplanes sp. URMC 104]|uniref:phage shock envelope stress response protein PspM n=1 Tax=Actinoplanes sp. URMC 104 TaxID=3423409 RepID=UPI003F1BB6B3